MYNNESDHHTLQPQGLPTGFNKSHLPVVTEQINTPALRNKAVIPVRKVWYQYSRGTTNQHNYTGYLTGVSNEPGKDNLFDRSDDYNYTVSQNNGLTTTTTTYNKYHLPLIMQQTDNLHHTLIVNNDVQYYPWRGTTFAKLPSTFSFPKQTIKTLYSLTSQGQDSTIAPVKIIQQQRYNDYGQVIWHEDTYGRQIFTQYCPPQGDAHCPKMDPNWPQVTFPEKVLQLPAKKTPQGSFPITNFAVMDDQTPAVEIEFNYRLIPIAHIYKTQLAYGKRLLQQQWVQTKQKWNKIHSNTKYQFSVVDLFSEQRFTDDVGEDTSNLAGNWQVTTKKVGTIATTEIANLKPGQPLPTLTDNQLSTTTDYGYNLAQDSATYGQLTHLNVTRYHHALLPVNNRYIQLNIITIDEHQISPEHIAFTVTHTIDTVHKTRTTDIEVASPKQVNDIKDAEQLFAKSFVGEGGGLSLGKSVYSLTKGVKVASEDTLKTLNTQWFYDVWQRPIKEVITPVEGGKPQTIYWTYIFTDKEQSVVKTLANGTQQKIIYVDHEKKPQILSTWHRDKSKSQIPLECISSWIQDSNIKYTKTDKPISKTVYHAADNNGKAVGLTTNYGYDGLNRQVWKQSSDGTVSVSVRNDSQLLLMNYQVGVNTSDQSEKLAPILQVVQANTVGKPIAQYSFALDSTVEIKGKALYTNHLQLMLNELKSQLKPVKELKPLQSYGLLPLSGTTGLFAFVNAAIKAGAWLTKINTQYDGNGRRIEQIQPNGARTHFYWQRGNLVATVAPNGSLIHDTFNIQGKKVSRCVQPADQSVCHILGTRGYDDTGNLSWQSDEYGNQIKYTYDADGRLLTKTTPATKTDKSHVFSYTYNSFAKTSAAVDGIIYATYVYNPTTWRLTDREDTISHLYYEYDNNTGQLTKVTRSLPQHLSPPIGIHYPTGIETLHYDRFGQIIQVTDWAGNTYRVTHDRYGRILQSYVVLPKQNKPTLLLSTTYDIYLNRPIKVINGMGLEREFIYNKLGSLESTRDVQESKLLQQLSYTYDVQTGNITSFTRQEGTESATQIYSYDKNTNSLTDMHCSVTGQNDTVSKLCPRDTDVSNSDLTSPPLIFDQHYTFDNWNNIKTVDEQLVTTTGKHTKKTTTYMYAKDKETTDNIDPHRMLGFSTQWQANVSHFNGKPKTITYDELGRVIKDAEGNTLHYNAFGQQNTFVNDKTGERTKYVYDSDGHQIAEQPFNRNGKVLQQPLYMIYQGNTVAEQVQEDNYGQHVSVELAGTAHSEDGQITRWYVHDYKGDVIASFNKTGRRISDHVYSPYGMDTDLLNTNTQSFPNKLALATQTAWWKSHQPGFDGQINDPATGYQFLGGGYRAYNPVYRHFMSHDSYSPFTKIDGYGFSDNNPIMNTDPTGHYA